MEIFQGRCVWCRLEIPRGRGHKVYFPGEFYRKIQFSRGILPEKWKFLGRGSDSQVEIPGVLNPPGAV